MAYVQRTALGRWVDAQDIGTARADLVMLILRAARVSPFNASNAPVPLTGVANATGLSPAIVESVLDTLLQEGFVEKLNSPKSNDASYRITGPGFEHVEQVRANGSFEDW